MSTYNRYDFNKYIERNNYKMPLTVKFNNNCVIEQRCEIKANSTFTNMLVGKSCLIGENNVLENSLICCDVKIGNNCKIINSIICSGVKIEDDVHVINGSVVGFNSHLKESLDQKFYFNDEEIEFDLK